LFSIAIGFISVIWYEAVKIFKRRRISWGLSAQWFHPSEYHCGFLHKHTQCS
jgi:hypothetical protein